MALVDINIDEYENVCHELAALLRQDKERKIAIDALKARVVEMAQGERLEFGISVKERSRVGAVSYKDLLANYDIPKKTIEKYRAQGSTWWEVKTY